MNARASGLRRVLLVALLALWTIGTTLPSASVIWRPPGTLGFRADYDGRIVEVDPQGVGARAGIAVGDRIDLPATPMENRVYAAPLAPLPQAGTSTTLVIARRSTTRSVTLVAPARDLSTAEKWSIIARIVAVMIFVIVGAALVLLRPSVVTWGFYLSCLGINPPPPATLSLAAFPWNLVIEIVAHFVFAAGTVGFIIFALRFPRTETSGWRASVERQSAAIFLVTAVLFVYPDVAPVLFGRPGETVQVLALAWASLTAVVVIAALAGTYMHGSGEDRQRIRWVIVGFAIGVSAAVVGGVLGYSSLFPIPNAAALANVILVFTAFVPLTVAYAVIRHRVLDVRFAISRALVYGGITSGAIVVFAIIDWFFGHVLAATKLAIFAEIAASVALGFGLNGVEKRVDALVDSVFFRARHIADRRLGRIAAALSHASTVSAVDDLIVSEPLDALELGSAALFRRNDIGQFVRTAANSWPADAPSSFDRDDTLFLQLQAELAPLHLSEIRWQHEGLPANEARPALAVPVVVRGGVVAAVIYGRPLSGEEFDPDAVALLNRLAVGAAAAYDHLEAQALRRRVAELEAMLDLKSSGTLST